MKLSVPDYELSSLGRINVLLGKNGCGKSYLLRQIEQELRMKEEYGIVRYLSPERGGFPRYDAMIEESISSDPNGLSEGRRKNQAPQFRRQSAAHYRRLETRFLRNLERRCLRNPDKTDALADDHFAPFDATIDRVNSLLDRVQLRRADPAFDIVGRKDGVPVQEQEISSGEAELISISLECLMFASECVPDKQNLLLFDEPDVHLHPDLQARLASFLISLFQDASFTLIIATHSTPLLSALSRTCGTKFAFMRYGQKEIRFSSVDDTCRKVLPVFGAHPLSSVFNESPILLVEGEDDERVGSVSSSV